jgi:deoxyribodipyrimidine photolyase-related protein
MGWVKRIPSLPHHTNAITTDAMALAERHFPDHFGDLLPLHYAVTREHAFGAFDSFIEPRLQTFGKVQDAMAQGTPWTYRGYISLNIN